MGPASVPGHGAMLVRGRGGGVFRGCDREAGELAEGGGVGDA